MFWECLGDVWGGGGYVLGMFGGCFRVGVGMFGGGWGMFGGYIFEKSKFRKSKNRFLKCPTDHFSNK